MSNELLMFVPTAIKAVMGDLAPRLAAVAGVSIRQAIDLNPAISARISSGESYDIGLTNPPYVTALIASGHAAGASHHPFGRIPLAIARKADRAGRPATNPTEIAAILRAAESIAYTGEGTSGRIFLGVAERLGVADAVASRGRAMAGGVPAQAVAKGEAEIAIAPLTTVLATPGVFAAAIFPDALQTHIDISVFLGPSAGKAAARVLAFLAASALDAELAEAGISRFELT